MIVCKNCGTQNAENESFCGECGAYLEWEGERVGEPEPVASAAAPPADTSEGPGLMQRVKDAVGIGGHEEQQVAPPASSPHTGQPSPESAPGSAGPPPAWAPAPGAGPSPWPAAPQQDAVTPQQNSASQQRDPQANGGSALVVPLAPAAPADRAAPTRPAAPAPVAATPTQPGSAPVRPGVSAVRPGAAPPRPRRRDLPPEDRPPAPGETICGYCGAGNAPSRKFCRRCGTDLSDAPVAKKAPWYKRIFAKQTAKAAPMAGARPKAAVKRTRRRRRTGRVRYVLVAVLALLLAAFFLFQSFWIDLYNKVLDHIQDPSQVSVAQISATSAAPDHAPGRATDAKPNTFWAPAPGGRAVGQSIAATFKSPIRLVKIGVYNGASDQGPDFVKQANVARIKVVLKRKDEGPKTMTFPLKPTPGLQTLDIGVGKVEAARITILAVDRPANAGRLVAVGELEFFAR